MSYEKYISDIQLAHKVQLQGWPWETNLQTPYAINVISDVRLLHDALKAGKCFWVKMTSQEYDDLSHEQQRRAPKTKKKGKGKRKRRGNDENADPSKRLSTSQKARKSRKTAAVQQPVRSRSVEGPPTERPVAANCPIGFPEKGLFWKSRPNHALVLIEKFRVRLPIVLAHCLAVVCH